MPGPEGGGGISAASASLDLSRGQASVDWAWSGGVHCATAADGSDIALDCGAGGGVITEIRFASYGAPEGQCGAFLQSESGCHHESATGALSAQCIGRSSCALAVAPELLTGDSNASWCATGANPQRMHVEAVCSASPSLRLAATLPLTSTGTVGVPMSASTSKLMLDGVTIWDRSDGGVSAAAAAADVDGVFGVALTPCGRMVEVSVGSGSYNFVLA